MTPHQGNTVLFRSAQQPTSYTSRASTTETHGHRFVTLGEKVPGRRQASKTAKLMLILNVRFLKIHIFTPILERGKSTEYK